MASRCCENAARPCDPTGTNAPGLPEFRRGRWRLPPVHLRRDWAKDRGELSASRRIDRVLSGVPHQSKTGPDDALTTRLGGYEKRQRAYHPLASARSSKVICPNNDLLVELRGFEPLTFSLRTKRATNCAKAPCGDKVSTAAGGCREGAVWAGSRWGRSDPGVEPHAGVPFVAGDRIAGVDGPEVGEAEDDDCHEGPGDERSREAALR
jgi:hypothetical protein